MYGRMYMSVQSLASRVDSRLRGIARAVPELVVRSILQELRYERRLLGRLMRWKMMRSHNRETRRRGMRLMNGRQERIYSCISVGRVVIIEESNAIQVFTEEGGVIVF